MSLSDTPLSSPPSCAQTGADVTLATFKTEVLEASHTHLVVVDFWAPWCGPCKQLMPLLESAVSATNGAAKLAKVNIDQNPSLAQHMRVQSVPTVFAFFGGQPIDAFQGALPESQINAWLAHLIATTGASGTDGPNTAGIAHALEQAAACEGNGDAARAHAIYADVFAQAPTNAQAFTGILRSLIALGQTQKAAQALAEAPAPLAQDKALNSVRAALELAAQAQKAQNTEQEWRERVAQDPNAHQARLDLALALYAAQKPQEAVEELLESLRRDRRWNDEAARKQLLKFFEALGPENPITIEGRKKLSSLLFS